ncbi:hypothetical protein HID58_076863, partial [Brassica napus]
MQTKSRARIQVVLSIY